MFWNSPQAAATLPFDPTERQIERALVPSPLRESLIANALQRSLFFSFRGARRPRDREALFCGIPKWPRKTGLRNFKHLGVTNF
jgi:hypothetical protein